MTDGDASDDRRVDEIVQARNNFDIMAAVGVGGNAHVDKLIDFSTEERHVRQVNNFQDLQDTVFAISDDICNGIDDLVQGKQRL